MSCCLFGMPFPICVLLCLCIWCFSELSKSFHFLPFCTALISSMHSLILSVPACFLHILQYDCFDLSLSFSIMISLVAVMVSKSGYFTSRLDLPEVLQKIEIHFYHYWLGTEIELYLTLFFCQDFTTITPRICPSNIFFFFFALCIWYINFLPRFFVHSRQRLLWFTF